MKNANKPAARTKAAKADGSTSDSLAQTDTIGIDVGDRVTKRYQMR